MPTHKRKLDIKKSRTIKVRVIKTAKKTVKPVKAEMPGELNRVKTEINKPNVKEQKEFKSIISVIKNRQSVWTVTGISFVIILVAWIALMNLLPAKSKTAKGDETLKSIGDVLSEVTSDFDEYAQTLSSQMLNLKKAITDEDQAEIESLEKRAFPQFYE